MDVNGRVVMITGAGQGMGADEAVAFASAGAKVVLADLADENVQALVAQIGSDKALAVHLDVRDTDNWARAVKIASDHFGRIDVLINNAGILRFTPVDQCSDEEWEQVTSINLTGTFKGIRAIAPIMKSVGAGSIINISSTAGIKAFGSVPAYVTSKFGVRGLTKAAALDLAPFNIRVNSIHPGNVETPMIEGLYHEYKHVPMNRAARPSEISKLAMFLASDASSFCTGSEFVADGGETAGLPALF
ncbi:MULTISPECIES: glucose 1-dehydrogenase [unclassified Rhizobium]|uniref:SDR family NAD(P)-dependent oxidoreductase n=1 Tax=unclassified Rhizobium TaxID=2613769 RepID=UPI00161C391F|nr:MULTISPECIES: glucose 1-dehydrogenase [unclassified Rhizobium]MBB3386205.1 3alpha(or 20beta)-hydroxysteroid dehydrogenase [Rhizobium sp. BK098]MBB3571181.1 3alpha(or 20beta)-hydroxysteroid dehydrogenase [Rhizobium sp. BK491]MBB3617909.1 3alpha(or 20beta)-hydroxysteroid dehydrogenase [Rhizobium sp. BK609]MBB3683638.1 3alpha(or 20beta)-hydroxysteroid dehydrogenase [Rhizobium sp. BK612]